MTQYIKCPDFVTRNSKMEITELRCKVCGTPIAGMTEHVRQTVRASDGTRHRDVVSRWARYHNYVELKMVLMGNLYHITSGCDKCLTMSLNNEQLDSLMETDIDEQASDLGFELAVELKARIAIGAVAVKRGGGIL